ncbi:MAG TPA: response regulator [Blastocatellia bacterium]|nr:response regulator [Blastocatellia bacterium]
MGSRILLADDSITIQKVVNLTFAEEGIEVVAVSSGDLAEKRLSEVTPDLVLADIFMPGKNGYELCESIKQNPQFRNVPVVLLVGAFEPFDQNEARRVRADAHLTKPFESRTLIETVRRLISSSPRTPTGPIAPPALPDDVREPARTTGPMASATSASLRSTTDELASATDFNLEAIGNEPMQPQTSGPSNAAALTDTSERFEPMELSSDFAPSTSESDSNGAMESSEMVLDFDKSDVFGEPASDPVTVSDSHEGTSLAVEVDGIPAATDWSAGDNGSAGGFEITAESTLETKPVEIAIASEGATDFNLTGAGSDPSTEPMNSPLLASDDPLGDVLRDDTGVSLDHVAPVDVLSNEALDVELDEPLTEEADDTGFILSQASQPAMEAVLPPEEAEPGVDQSAGTADEAPRFDAPVKPAGDLDWTSPHARSYSTAQLDSVVMSVEAREHIEVASARDNGHAPAEVETGFASSAMAEEEAHFAPIDIEAAEVIQTDDAATDSETGFSFSSVIDEEPAHRNDNATTTAPGVAFDNRPAELSTAAIEEIVRRVIAQMSESVVREVAWEVVPDCVERVINQLTRESMSRRV